MAQADPPGFLEVQRAFAAHIRNPELNPPPRDVDPRRMQIYVRLFHRNITSFLDSGFPKAKSALGGDRWRSLVQGFFHRHASETPYFLDIGQEFMAFLDEDPSLDVPDWLVELCHYEWVKRSLKNAGPDIPESGIDRNGDLLAGQVVVSPLTRPLCYRYRVHEIGPERIPGDAPAAPTWLIGCRRRNDRVHFVASNALTHRLLEILAPGISGNEALASLSAEFPRIDPGRLQREGAETLGRLCDAEVLLGVRVM